MAIVAGRSGSLLLAARRRRGLSQAQVAARAGTSQPVISAYEHDRRDPTTATLARLIAATGNRLVLGLAQPEPAIPPATSSEESSRRLVDVLLLADAIPRRADPGPLDAPEMRSRSSADGS